MGGATSATCARLGEQEVNFNCFWTVHRLALTGSKYIVFLLRTPPVAYHSCQALHCWAACHLLTLSPPPQMPAVLLLSSCPQNKSNMDWPYPFLSMSVLEQLYFLLHMDWVDAGLHNKVEVLKFLLIWQPIILSYIYWQDMLKTILKFVCKLPHGMSNYI